MECFNIACDVSNGWERWVLSILIVGKGDKMASDQAQGDHLVIVGDIVEEIVQKMIQVIMKLRRRVY